jgi:predicted nucleic acid-binding protein
MKDKVIVPDSSCLILFHQMNKIDLFKSIITRLNAKLVLLTPVVEELHSLSNNEIKKYSTKYVLFTDYDEYQNKFKLGKGEAAVLSYTEKNNCIAILDDLKARRIAYSKNIQIIGTMGLLGTGYILCPIGDKAELKLYLANSLNFGFRLPPVDKYLSKLKKK